MTNTLRIRPRGVRRWLTAYLVYSVAASLLLLSVPPAVHAYARAWAALLPGQWMLGLCSVLETYSLITAPYPGIATAAKWAMRTTAPLSFLAAAVGRCLNLQNPGPHLSLLGYELRVHSTMLAATVLCLILPLSLVMRFPITLSRSAARHCFLLMLFMTSEAAVSVLHGLLGAGSVRIANLVSLVMANLCLAGCVALPGGRREDAAAPARSAPSPAIEARVLVQLDALQRTLAVRTRRSVSAG